MRNALFGIVTFFYLLTPEDGTDGLSRNVSTKLPLLGAVRNNPEERSSRSVLLFHSYCRVPGYGTLYSGTQFPTLKYSMPRNCIY